MKKLILETTAPFQGLPELVAHDEGLFEQEGLLKARKAPPEFKPSLLRLARQRIGMARYLDRNPHRGPVPAVTSPSLAPA
jgi:hypothetical protein